MISLHEVHKQIIISSYLPLPIHISCLVSSVEHSSKIYFQNFIYIYIYIIYKPLISISISVITLDSYLWSLSIAAIITIHVIQRLKLLGFQSIVRNESISKVTSAFPNFSLLKFRWISLYQSLVSSFLCYWLIYRLSEGWVRRTKVLFSDYSVATAEQRSKKIEYLRGIGIRSS